MCANHSEELLTREEITLENLLQGNKDFVERTLEEDPEYFNKLSAGQKPPVLWIGCSDSRVPADKITNTMPGDIFVTRNIANVVTHTDISLLSVLDYSVNVLKIKHIIVCGHYGCGGVAAAHGNKQVGLIDNWLRNIKDVYRFNQEEIDGLPEDQKVDRLVELNAIHSANNVMSTSIVQNAWANGQELSVHAWVYSLKTGLINDLKSTFSAADDMDPVFKMSI
ncbi:carbonic anhydrase [Pedobacter cryotolerans]|jgi:carbonic anhydrase|uniref:Carbonic anhydrase 2 n=1 Tax=Pedobacter cryotolerans TaxID=2571270 RepID=A0A4U1BZH0_9SPHI|nr:carbonic anhydrase [Pedobacter cryotolerans]TKB98212.1 carbonic anhydrase [Pedobacter cryotolerans]